MHAQHPSSMLLQSLASRGARNKKIRMACETIFCTIHNNSMGIYSISIIIIIAWPSTNALAACSALLVQLAVYTISIIV